MKVETVFCNSLSILQKFGSQLRLSLSKEPNTLRQQICQIQRTQTHLLKLNQKLAGWLMPQETALAQAAHTQLTQLIQAMGHEAHTLQLLAEEFPLDPEGTEACLAEVQARIQCLLQQVSRLKTEGLQRDSFRDRTPQPASWTPNPRVPYPAVVAAKAHQSASGSGLAASTSGAFPS